jgi:glucokinase
VPTSAQALPQSTTSLLARLAEIVGERFRTRLEARHSGHLGASYIPELMQLAEHAQPLGGYPLFDVDTTQPLDRAALAAWLEATFKG